MQATSRRIPLLFVAFFLEDLCTMSKNFSYEVIKMLTGAEVKAWLLENCVNSSGDLDISFLDFSDFDGNIFATNWRAKGDIICDGCTTQGFISQSNHVAKQITQTGHRADRVLQFRHTTSDSIHQYGHQSGKNIYQDRQVAAGNIVQGKQYSQRHIYQEHQIAHTIFQQTHQAQGNIYQDNQLCGGSIYQQQQQASVDIFSSELSAHGSVYQNEPLQFDDRDEMGENKIDNKEEM